MTPCGATTILQGRDAVQLAKASRARLIAIDGLPTAGKSTLADTMAREIEADCVSLDEFVRPEQEWRGQAIPCFPFAYIRYGQFLDAVKALVSAGTCSYRPYDWTTGEVGEQVRVVSANRPVVIEGVSTLHPDLAPLYQLRLWVESDPGSTLAGALRRGVGTWEREWRELFLPSVDLYLEINPRGRADALVCGRGYEQVERSPSCLA